MPKKRFGVSFAFDILSVLLGAAFLVFPESLLFAESMMLIMTAIWFVMMGIVTIINSVSVKKATGSGIWVLPLIFGILDVLIGCYTFFHPMVMAVSLGILIGIYFIETGFTMIFTGTSLKD